MNISNLFLTIRISGKTYEDSLFSLEKLSTRFTVNPGSEPPILDSLIMRITIIPIQFSVIRLDLGKRGAWSAYYALQTAKPVHCKTEKCAESGRLGKSASDSTIAYYELGVLKNVASGIIGSSDAAKIKTFSKTLRSSKGRALKLPLKPDCPMFLVSEKIGRDSSVNVFSRFGDADQIRAIAGIFSVLAKGRGKQEMGTLEEVVRFQMEIMCKD